MQKIPWNVYNYIETVLRFYIDLKLLFKTGELMIYYLMSHGITQDIIYINKYNILL
jgi:hypothetical protein